ncbi:MAG: cupin domain-containing protein [Phycisphaeraceae bacterium JB051]
MINRSGLGFVVAVLSLAFFLTGCESTGSTQSTKHPRVRVITPGQVYSYNRWSAAERSQDVATRSIRVTRNASYHMICLNKAEKPHVHDNHDMVVTVLCGQTRLHLNMKTYDLNPGDVVEIPRGTLHWTENLNPSGPPAEAFAVFTPAFQGKDIRFVNVPGQ